MSLFFIKLVKKIEFDEKSAKKISLINSIILGLIFMILTIALYDNYYGCAPAILYYYINIAFLQSSIFVEKNNKLKKKEK